jgi:hypothetical protein
MIATITRLPRQILVDYSSLLIAVTLAGSFALMALPRFSSNAFAATLQQVAAATCAQAPSPAHCNNQDPERQGCAADAETIDQATILENGIPIGQVERRYSLKCQSWWGRVFDQRAGSQANMSITIAGAQISAAPTFVGNSYRILYSPMIFDATPTQTVPAITGTLAIDAISQPAGATLPAITIPGH